MNMDWKTSLPFSLHLFLLKVKILEKCVYRVEIKQNVWLGMQRTGKGWCLAHSTLPPPPLQAKKASLFK